VSVVRLTKKDLEILSLSAQGLTSRDIAEQTQRSINTVKSQKSRIIRKLDARNMPEAVFKSVHEIAKWRDG
jgi:LuxR family transcriptional regulator